MAYTDQYAVAMSLETTEAYRQVMMAMVQCAVAIVGEAVGEVVRPMHASKKRHSLAVRVLQDRETWVRDFMFAVYSDAALFDAGTVDGEGDADSDVFNRVSAVWDKIAGVGQKPSIG